MNSQCMRLEKYTIVYVTIKLQIEHFHHSEKLIQECLQRKTNNALDPETLDGLCVCVCVFFLFNRLYF